MGFDIGPNLTTIVIAFIGLLTTLLGGLEMRRRRNKRRSDPPSSDETSLDTTVNDLPPSSQDKKD